MFNTLPHSLSWKNWKRATGQGKLRYMYGLKLLYSSVDGGKAGTKESGRGCQCSRARKSLNRVRAGVRVNCRGNASPTLRVCGQRKNNSVPEH